VADAGTDIKENGWRQGCILKPDDLDDLITSEDPRQEPERVGIVVSHSCDLAHGNLDGEPFAEIVIGVRTDLADDAGRRGAFTYGKNPRRLCLAINQHPEGERWYEILACRVERIKRAELAKTYPDHTRFLDEQSKNVLSTWLAERYRRPAFPDRFNQILSTNKYRLKKIYKRISPHVSAIYVRLFPECEAEEGEGYSINLLAVIPVADQEHLEDARESIQGLVEALQSVDIDVQAAQVLNEDQVSLAIIRDMKKMPLEAFSLAGGQDQPVPVDH